VTGGRYFIKSIFQVKKIDFLHFIAKLMKDLAFGPPRQVWELAVSLP
jgi:hypothetical protein